MKIYRLLFGAILLLPGCYRQTADGQSQPSASAPGTNIVSTVKPERKTLKRTVEQPGQIEAFEETPLYARIPGYVGTVWADIGMVFKGPKLDSSGKEIGPGDVLAKLSVPELNAELDQKKALVKQAESEVAQAEASLKAADAHVATLSALVEEAKAGKERVDANYERWSKEYNRLNALVTQKVIDEQSRDEVLNQRQAAEAGRKEYVAKVLSAEAAHAESKAKRDKANADLSAAKARVLVALAEQARLAAMVQYADIRAPYNCTVIRRNVHTGHFLQPGPGTGSQPIFVVARTDVLRVVVDVPETDAMIVTEGLPAVVRVQSAKDRDFPGKVARTSGSLDSKSRTLRTEIDLDNTDKALRPGMYAYVTFKASLADRMTLPAAAVSTQGNKAFCWQIIDGKAKQTPLRVGVRQDGIVEVLQKQSAGSSPTWANLSGDEVVIMGNLANLTEGQAVSVK